MKPLVVLGDLLLDRDVTGRAHRLTPDAPVPVLESCATASRPGGAALAAVLARRHHGHVVLVGALADDDAGRELRALVESQDVEVVPVPLDGATPTKTRLLAGGHPLLRVDAPPEPGGVVVDDRAVAARVDGAAALLVSDYGRGLVEAVVAGAATGAALRARATRHRVVWDPHVRGARPLPGAYLTPNLDEAHVLAAGHEGEDGRPTDVARLAQRVRQHLAAAGVALTLGEGGVVLSTTDAAVLSVPVRVARGDPCGAGDAFAARFAAGLALGATPGDAVADAAEAAASFVANGGAGAWRTTTAATRTGRGRGDRAEVLRRAHEVHAHGGRVVATSGCFDLLHVGHTEMLHAARAHGDHLVVLLNSDASVRRLKGPDRPVQSVDDRARILSALRPVDDVVVFDEDDPRAVLAELRPDVFVKGGDYAHRSLVEERVLAAWGGVVRIVPYHRGRSTTSLIEHTRTGGTP